MDIKALEPHELTTLLGFLVLLMRADGEHSDEEKAVLGGVAQRLGDGWGEAWARARAEVRSSRDAQDLARTVVRPEARQAILFECTRAAAVDGIDPKETLILDWLRSAWA